MAAKTIGELKRNIIQTKNELSALSNDQNPIPELINSTNLLRTNDFLIKTGEKKSELLTAYDQYSKQLENTLTKIIKIQDQLKKFVKKDLQERLLGKRLGRKNPPREKNQQSESVNALIF